MLYLETAMKCLFIDINASYVNQTRNLLPNVFRFAADTTCYGPGYLDSYVLQQGLDEFIERTGPYDMLIATEHIMFGWLGSRSLPAYKRNYVLTFSQHDLAQLENIYQQFSKRPECKLATLFESDYYNFTQHQISILNSFEGYLTGWGSDFIRPVNTLPYAHNERFYTHASDLWFEFTIEQHKRYLSLPAFLDDAEFNWSPLSQRQSDWSLVGAGYWSRGIARKHIRSLPGGCSGDGLVVVNKTYALLQRLGANPYGNYYLQKFSNLAFRRTIETTRYSYTCGSGLGYPLRKFFEIPALGTVLVCSPCNGFEALGFRHGHNAIACLPDQIFEVHRMLQQDPEKAQQIASNARELIWKRHTVRARAGQFRKAITAMISGNFAGAHWSDGDLVYHEPTIATTGQAS